MAEKAFEVVSVGMIFSSQDSLRQSAFFIMLTEPRVVRSSDFGHFIFQPRKILFLVVSQVVRKVWYFTGNSVQISRAGSLFS